LLVAHLLHPLDGLAVELFHNRDMRHGRRRRGAVPVLLTRRAPDHVARPNPLDRAAPALHQAAAIYHDQVLPQRMRVPCGPGARLERDAGRNRARRTGRLEQGIDAHSAGEILRRPFAGGL
jgi:hypothetical protein